MQLLRHHVGHLILACFAHVDTADFYCRELPKGLEHRCVGITRRRRNAFIDGNWISTGYTVHPSRRSRQPVSKEPIERLSDIQRHALSEPAIRRLFLLRQHVAVEYITATQRDADRLHATADRWVSLKGRDDKTISHYLEMTYWRPRRAPRNLAGYSDMPSKFTGLPCFRLELRLQRRSGRRLIADAAELLAVNPQELFRRCLYDPGTGLLDLIPQELTWP